VGPLHGPRRQTHKFEQAEQLIDRLIRGDR
jgi:hypothetical protein